MDVGWFHSYRAPIAHWRGRHARVHEWMRISFDTIVSAGKDDSCRQFSTPLLYRQFSTQLFVATHTRMNEKFPREIEEDVKK